VPSILKSGNEHARKAALDEVPEKKFQAEIGFDGSITASTKTKWKGLTFTGYVKALVVGKKAVSGGLRIEA